MLLVSFAPTVGAATVDDARADLAGAYVVVSRAETAGGNVTGLVLRLNEAARLIDSGGVDNVSKAGGIIGEVVSAAPLVQSSGVERITNRYIVTGVVLVVLVAAGVAVWFRGSRWVWGAWLRARGGWRVERV